MTVIHLKKKDVVKSSVKGVAIEFDHDRLASILGVPGKNGIYEYIKDVWEESKYTKPLEITRRFGKRDTSSFMDLTYMDHLMARRLANFPRVKMRHMSYVISMKDHELPYGDWLTMLFEEFGVPLVDKKGEEPKRYDYFEETFLTMCKLTRENGVWWIGTGENRRRDDVLRGNPDQMSSFMMLKWMWKNQHCRLQPLQAVMNKLQAEFKRARANQFQADLEKAQAENARLLALLQQAQTKPKP
ncbi:hypothetical protein Dimus_007888 [Dionaea muscipula]